MTTLLDQFVTASGLALQAEDCLIRAAIHHRGERGGLVRIQKERHCQFIIWKALLPKWHVELERGFRDIIIVADAEEHNFELKYWRTETVDVLLAVDWSAYDKEVFEQLIVG